IPFDAGDPAAAGATRTFDIKPAGAQPHCRLDRALHGAAKRDATLELLRDRFRDELGIQFRLADLDDIDHDIRFRQRGDLSAKLFDVGTLLADDHARPSRLNRDTTFLVWALDHDLRHGGLLAILHHFFAGLHGLVQQLAVTLL